MLYFLKQKYKITAYSGEENHFDAIWKLFNSFCF